MDLVDLTALKKALTALQDVLKMPANQIPQDILRDSAIQRFEFSYELIWKTLRRHLKVYYGKDEKHAYSILKLAHEMKLIDDLKLWESFHEARNKSSHIYNEVMAKEIFQVSQLFLPVALETLRRMEVPLAGSHQ